jgi:kynurenine formamidase
MPPDAPRPYAEIVDLTHEMYNGMPNIGGVQIAFWPIESYDTLSQYSGGKLAMESRMMLLAEHCGTHLDAPRHFDPDGLSLSTLPLRQLVLPGHLLDFTHIRNGEAITIADFEAAEAVSGRRIGPGTAVTAWTGVDKHWGQGDWIRNRPYVPTEVAQWLVDRGITLFATDLIGMDDPSEWWWPTHAAWLKAGVCMVQQLCNLDKLKGREYLFVALPLKIREGTGCPVRAVAIVS